MKVKDKLKNENNFISTSPVGKMVNKINLEGEIKTFLFPIYYKAKPYLSCPDMED